MTQAQARQLRDAFRSAFGGEAQHVKVAPDRYRFELLTPAFDDVTHYQRQLRVWEVVDRTLDADAKLGITLIFPYAPADFDEERERRELEQSLTS